MKKLNEKKIIEILQKKINVRHRLEDVEIFEMDKKLLVSKIDTLVESTDVPPKIKYDNIARKSIVSCVSDFAAKGVKPLFAIISITLPDNITESKVNQLALGFKKAAKEFDLKILGGDTNQGIEMSISVAMFGTSKGYSRRYGAKTRDGIFVTGPFGYSKAGLKILLNKKRADKKFRDKAISAISAPLPKLNFGISCSKYFTSSMDSSDGLAISLYELARQSSKRFTIDHIPADDTIYKFADKNKLDALDLIFYGGEEFEIIFTADIKDMKQILHLAKIHKIQLVKIGTVSKGNGVMLDTNDIKKPLEDKGWQHLQDNS